MKTEELIRALAIDSTLPQDAAVGIAASVGAGLAVMLFFAATGFAND